MESEKRRHIRKRQEKLMAAMHSRKKVNQERIEKTRRKTAELGRV